MLRRSLRVNASGLSIGQSIQTVIGMWGSSMLTKTEFKELLERIGGVMTQDPNRFVLGDEAHANPLHFH
jgi:hypothetical protein